MNLFQLKYLATALKIIHILQRKKKKKRRNILHVTAPEGQTQHFLTGCREHYCSLNAIHYGLQINYAAGGL